MKFGSLEPNSLLRSGFTNAEALGLARTAVAAANSIDLFRSVRHFEREWILLEFAVQLPLGVSFDGREFAVRALGQILGLEYKWLAFGCDPKLPIEPLLFEFHVMGFFAVHLFHADMLRFGDALEECIGRIISQDVL